MADMRHALATFNTNNFIVYGQKHSVVTRFLSLDKRITIRQKLSSLGAILFCNKTSPLLTFQRLIVMRLFYVSYKQVKMTYSLPRAYAVFCGRLIITAKRDYLYAKKQGKQASFCFYL